jgi:hypothetical protein
MLAFTPTTGEEMARLRHAVGGHLYGGPSFAGAVAADLDLALLEPANDWLTHLPFEYTHRDITLTTIGEARWSRTPSVIYRLTRRRPDGCLAVAPFAWRVVSRRAWWRCGASGP